jgi:sigma-E factor negative regulatory protein RseC
MFIKGIERQVGEVVAVHDGSATVRVSANKNCDRCGICERVSDTQMVVEASTSHRLAAGEKVVLSVNPGAIVKSATVLYILPLLGLVAGYYASGIVLRMAGIDLEGELVPALCAIAALFLCFVPIRLLDVRRRNKRRYHVYVKERV